MKQYLINAYSIESTSKLSDNRQVELKKQKWNRAKSQLMADSEDITLSDEHWKVLSCLRKRYRYDGLPRHARYLAKSLIREFATQGGNKYLRKLFPGGPVTQGSRFANVSVPPDAADVSHGSCY
ncbi:MAG: TusE/DsrC/DsvC family sulfur relay protein [Gammaproteobacteria bacterium]|nr:TusE/DsrC/DsvC family sulfur relay protein [Gammaproteobacteria bacterium]